jgi:transglutaminase-like putative cysteine protease
MTVTYEITHRTRYTYASDVTPSFSLLHLLPRDLPGQRCLDARLEIDPAPEDLRERTDFFGNRVAYAVIRARHRRLEVTARSRVEVDGLQSEPSLFAQRPWELVRDGVRTATGDDVVPACDAILDSPLVRRSGDLADYALQSFTPGRQLLDALGELCGRIHADFAYAPGATSVSTPLEEVLVQRRGVCQDFAHVGIGCLRSIGLPARYVSGYLETDPPPGRPKLTGADALHAWLSLVLPEGGRIAIDPTNDQVVNGRYVVCAVGRDYGDVAPLGGVIFTKGRTRSLEVEVDVTAVAG